MIEMFDFISDRFTLLERIQTKTRVIQSGKYKTQQTLPRIATGAQRLAKQRRHSLVPYRAVREA